MRRRQSQFIEDEDQQRQQSASRPANESPRPPQSAAAQREVSDRFRWDLVQVCRPCQDCKRDLQLCCWLFADIRECCMSGEVAAAVSRRIRCGKSAHPQLRLMIQQECGPGAAVGGGRLGLGLRAAADGAGGANAGAAEGGRGAGAAGHSGAGAAVWAGAAGATEGTAAGTAGGGRR